MLRVPSDRGTFVCMCISSHRIVGETDTLHMRKSIIFCVVQQEAKKVAVLYFIVIECALILL